MKKLINLLSIIIVCVSCKSNHLEFSADSSVFFRDDTDSTKVSFTYFDNTTQTYDVNLYADIIGEIVDYDREVKVKITSKNCVEGIDCLAIPETYTIKAGSGTCLITVTLIRTENLKKEEKFISIELMENKDFSTHHITENNKDTNFKTIDKIKHTIRFSEFMTEQPKTWSDYYFGTFSYKKFTTICDVMSIPRSKFIEYSYMTHGRQSYIAIFMKNHFVAEKAAGRTVYEEDGVTEMKMGDKI